VIWPDCPAPSGRTLRLSSGRSSKQVLQVIPGQDMLACLGTSCSKEGAKEAERSRLQEPLAQACRLQLMDVSLLIRAGSSHDIMISQIARGGMLCSE
jgi:hypothetical protein